jgi:predicted nucleic acid-binding protein
MKYLLDTNILVNLLRGQSTPDLKYFKSGCAISIITFAELLYGALKSQKPSVNSQLIHSLIDDLNLMLLDLDTTVITQYAPLRVTLEQKGFRLEDFDLLIAATALSHNLTLVTANTKHFLHIPKLKTLSPTKNLKSLR